MNKQRRKKLSDIATRIETLSNLAILDFDKLRQAAPKLNAEMENVREVMSDEEDAFDNMPEGLQANRQDAYDAFNEATQAVVDALSELLATTRDDYDTDEVEQLFTDIADSLNDAQD